jgi:cytochrome c oxidase subunit 3
MTANAFTREEEKQRAIRGRRTVTWLIVFAIVMFFAGLTSAYVVSMSGGYWVEIKMPKPFLVSTAAIVVSSVFVQLALVSARQGRSAAVAPLLLVSLALGLVFTWSQFKGWGELTKSGNFLVSKVLDNKGVYGVDYTIRFEGEALIEENGKFFHPSDVERARPLNAELDEQKNTSSSYFFALTGAHLAHLVFGLLSLLVMVVMALMGRYTPQDHVGLWAGTVYWHFLGGLWVYLFSFLLIVH